MPDSMDALVLDGSGLTIKEVYDVAHNNRKVLISEHAFQQLIKARSFIFDLVDQDIPVYGFNRGVGWNKDKIVDPSFFAQYNRNLILSHCAGVSPDAAEEDVRAVMLARLNGLLLGHSGIQPEIAKRYADFLNFGIHPVLPLRGSVGASDITVLSHVGLAFIGEGEVMMHGIRLPAAEALAANGLNALALGPKDALAIVSSNALSAGTGALALYDGFNLLQLADIVYALSLEALRGNVSPLDKSVHQVRPFAGQLQSLETVRKLLRGSDLWGNYNHESLQDPLSFRDACQINGAARDALSYTIGHLELHLNSSDDNPCVLPDKRQILSCANFDPISWTLGFEMLGQALHHVSKSSCYRTIKLGIPAFTGLSRFLTPDEDQSIGYCTAQKTITALDAEIRHLSNPASSDYLSLAGDIEDHGTNAPFVVSKTRDIIDRMYYILGIEALHAVQAIDLRSGIRQGQGTEAAYRTIRSIVPFLSEDRNLTVDFEKVYQIFRNGKLLNQVHDALSLTH